MLSPNFNRHEFACKCGCGLDTVDTELAVILEVIREHFGQPVTVNSACRCPVYNKDVGGADNSQHLLGRAADIVVAGVDPADVQSYIAATWPDDYGLGRYDSFTHIDSRGQKARW